MICPKCKKADVLPECIEEDNNDNAYCPNCDWTGQER